MNPDLTLTVTRDIAARPNAVWRCLTEPDLVRQWFAPAPVTVTTCEIDARPGGILNVVMQMPGHDPMAEPPGCALLAEPPARLVWTAALGPGFVPNPPHDNPEDFYITVDIRLTETQDGTEYRANVLHATQTSVAAHERMGFVEGWGQATDQLAALAASL